MTTFTPPVWLGSAAVTGITVPATSIAAPHAQTPEALRPDFYIRAGTALNPSPRGAVLPFPEDMIRFEGAGLPFIHRAGVGADPSAILSEFPDVRRFKNGRADALAVLWRQYDEEVAALALDVRQDREYLDPENPLKLGEDAAELANLRPLYRPELVALHHELRRSLAEEQTFVANLRKGFRYSVRFRVLNQPAPVRDGTVPVDRAAIVALLDRYENFAKPLGREPRARLERGLVLVGAARGFQEVKAWTHRPTVAATVNRLLPHWNPAARKRAVFFQSLLEAEARGRDLFPLRGGRTTYWKVFKSVAAALGGPMEDMLRQTLGPAVERWKSDHFLRMDRLKDFLSLCNLLGASQPWRLAWRLHQEELTWAFSVIDLGRGELGFEIDSDSDLNLLREHGFGGVLTAARMERGWNLPRLREAVTEAYGADVSLDRLGAVAANREQPDFPLLRAIVAGLAMHETALPVDPSEAFLAAYPTFIDLLPLAARGERRLLKPAADSPVAFVPYAEPIASAATVTSRGAAEGLDLEGFPYLIVRARGLRRLTVTAAAQRLGIAGATLARYERETNGRAASLPGRVTLNVVCDPAGYDLPRAKALAAHVHSYWRSDPAAILIIERNDNAPIFLEENNADQWRAYAAHSQRTPGEILFAWRNGVPPEGSPATFLATETQQASVLGVPLATYRRWEGNAFAPSRAEAEALCARLGRSEGEASEFWEACVRLRAARVSESAEEGVAGLESFPALGRFAASLALRPFFGEENRDRLNYKLVALIERDPGSLAFLETKIAGTEGGVSPDSEEAARLIAAVHRAEEKTRLWPEGIERLGPIAAYAYHQHRAEKAVWGRLARALRNPRVNAVIFGEDGSCEIAGLGAHGGRPPAKIKVSGPISRPDARAVKEIIRRLKAAGRLNNKVRVKSFSDRAVALAQHDDASFRDFLARAAAETDWDRLCGALENAANFVRKWKGAVAWTGSVFGYYYDNDEKGAKGRRSAAIYLRTRLDRGNVASVRFDGKRVGFEPVKAPAPSVRRGPGAQTFSYADAESVRFLPHPVNDWGRHDLDLSWSDVQARVTAFFARLEKRLGKTPIEIQRVLGRSYYAVRTGADVLGGEFLSDGVLERLGLTDVSSQEELRHLEALLQLSRGEGQERGEGPYVAVARVLRYYRLLHQKKQSEVKALYKSGPSIVGPADYELGRMAVDPATLPALAAGLGVPRPFRQAFVERLRRDYAAIAALRARGAEARPETSFPNAGWTIPHEDWSEAGALDALKSMASEARVAISRGDLARNTGLTASHLYKFENFGELSEDAWPIYRKFLEADGRADLARRIRVARAVLDLRRKPVPAGPGFADVGRLLRFTRLMMIGMSAADVIAALKGGIDPQLYLRWEAGLNRMPEAIAANYARLLVAHGVLTAQQAGAFVRRLREEYLR